MSMARTRLILIGHSGNAMEILEHLQDLHEVVAFLDDGAVSADRMSHGVPVLPLCRLADFPDAQVLVTFGSVSSLPGRARVVAGLGLAPQRFATVIHPRAHVSRRAMLGPGTIVFPGAVITWNAIVGDHCMILPNSVIHHDVVLEDHVLVGSNATVAGHCRVGCGSYLGSACSVKNGVTIGRGSVIGMAANVLRDCPDGAVMVGNPARPLVVH